MTLQTHLTQLRQESLTEIRDTATQFFVKYHAVHHLHTIFAQDPSQADSECIAALQAVLTSPEFAHQRQSLFLYRMAAEALTGLFAAASSRKQARQALNALEAVLACTSGHAHRATAESMALLPVTIPGPPLPRPMSDCPETDWRCFFSVIDVQPLGPPALKGRSLVYALSGTQSQLVIKLAKPYHDPHTLQLEAHWMTALQSMANSWPLRFDVPTPIAVDGSHLVRLHALPPPAGTPSDFHSMRYALAFLAPPDYYHYPNDDRRRISNGQFLEILARNAWLMGKLATCGIVHDAAIPLFHNRVQRHRRRDQGHYEWFRGGRLDRWLESCRHPNIGPSGLRDFEHFQSIGSSGRNLYRQIGAAFLSLLLIAGSYFRNRDAALVGRMPDGSPIDARHLFDPSLLGAACRGAVGSHDEAERALVRALEAEPLGSWAADPEGPLIWLLRLLAEQGRDEELHRWLERYHAAVPGDARPLAIALGEAERLGQHQRAVALGERAAALRTRAPNPSTRARYRALHARLRDRGIHLVVASYPRRDRREVDALVEGLEGVTVVDNGPVFEQAVEQHGFEALFTDRCYGDFGHGSPLGNRILAENIAHALRALPAPPPRTEP